MGEQLAYAVDIHHRLAVGYVDGGLYLVLAYYLAHLAGKLVVYAVSGTGGDDASLYGLAYEGEVADDVKQFVARGFVVPHKGFVVEVAEFGGIHVGYAHDVGKTVVFVLGQLALVDDDGIVEVTAFYKACREQGLKFADKDEGAARCNLFLEVVHAFERGILVEEYVRVVVYKYVETEFFVGEDND